MKKDSTEDYLSPAKLFAYKWQDILVTDLCHLLPSMLSWFYHLKIKKELYPHHFKEATGKKAVLYEHDGWALQSEEVEPVLILHGLYSHPLIMLHLSKLMKRIHKGPVFDFYVSYDQIDASSHRALLTSAIDKIEQMIEKKGGRLKGIIAIGHSMGAIEAAYKAFVEEDRRIASVISIAGPLKEIESGTGSSRTWLQDSLKKINSAIQKHPEIPLYQIVGRYDWNASLDSTLVRKTPGSYCIIENAMHFNILFKKELYDELTTIMHNFSHPDGFVA